MSNQQGPGWRNWSDHPLVVFVGILAGLVGIPVGLIAIFLFITGQSSPFPSDNLTPEVHSSSGVPTSTSSIAQETTASSHLAESSPSPKKPTFTVQAWEGELNQYNYGKYPMILYIEEENGPLFKGKLHWPSLRNSITSMSGEYVTDFDDIIEQSKWSYIEGFEPDADGIWLKFTETELLQGGNIILNGQYYAHIRDDGVMIGVYFRTNRDSEPDGDFIIARRP